jgi:hypothetical protein
MITPPIRKKPPALHIRNARTLNATMRGCSPTAGAKGNPNLYIWISIERTISRYDTLTLGI